MRPRNLILTLLTTTITTITQTSAHPFKSTTPPSSPPSHAALRNPPSEKSCHPTTYSLSNFQYTFHQTTGATLKFTFQSAYANPSVITDRATSLASCATASSRGVLPLENRCSRLGEDLKFEIRGPQDEFEYQIVHKWWCGGQQWASSTPFKFDWTECGTDAKETKMCSAKAKEVQPASVRRICDGVDCVFD